MNQIPFNTHFNWDFNLVSVLALMGNRTCALKGLLDFGVPYITGDDGKTPMCHAVEINDQEMINVLVNHLSLDINQLEFFDTEHMIKNFIPAWKNNFTF